MPDSLAHAVRAVAEADMQWLAGQHPAVAIVALVLIQAPTIILAAVSARHARSAADASSPTPSILRYLRDLHGWVIELARWQERHEREYHRP